MWGVIYYVARKEILSLDKEEGYKPGRASNAYVRQEATVFVNGKLNSPVACLLYIAREQAAPTLPTRDYMHHLIRGAKVHGLPEAYIAVLERLDIQPEAAPDPN